ncbi:TPA: hypothetical protein VGT17_005235 [Vibrio harveyi]|nr:hypothetical protein [Vibrio harveyi]HEQ3599233.1 hypothetical protein [Vibrio harveyi]HEQ3611325.1 hypothetical protein [Vibrio harveyi]
MPQKLNLSPEQLSQAEAQSDMSKEYIPALDGATHYLAYVPYQGARILCILKDGKWTPTNQGELLKIMTG